MYIHLADESRNPCNVGGYIDNRARANCLCVCADSISPSVWVLVSKQCNKTRLLLFDIWHEKGRVCRQPAYLVSICLLSVQVCTASRLFLNFLHNFFFHFVQFLIYFICLLCTASLERDEIQRPNLLLSNLVSLLYK